MSRKRKSVTAWAVFLLDDSISRASVRPTRAESIRIWAGSIGNWRIWKRRGYTVRKVTITEAK